MGRFRHAETGVEFTVDDSKDDRYKAASGLYESVGAEKSAPKKAPAKSADSKTEK